MDVNAMQVGGDHYRSGYQHWDFVHNVLDDRYLEGNITKYVVRHRRKNGVQDIEKAIHYLSKLIEECRVGNSIGIGSRFHDSPYHTAEHFCSVNGVHPLEARIIRELSRWSSVRDLLDVGALLVQLKAEVQGAEPAGAGYVDQD